MFGMGIAEIIVIVLIVALLFGPSRIKRAGSLFSETLHGFRNGLKGDESDDSTTPESSEISIVSTKTKKNRNG